MGNKTLWENALKDIDIKEKDVPKMVEKINNWRRFYGIQKI
mgnify:CR=1 FL=1